MAATFPVAAAPLSPGQGASGVAAADLVGAPSPEPQSPSLGPAAPDAVVEPQRAPRRARPKRCRRDDGSGEEAPGQEQPQRRRLSADSILGVVDSKPPSAAAGGVSAVAVQGAAVQEVEEPSDVAPQRRPRSNGSSSGKPGQRSDPAPPKPDVSDYRMTLAAVLRQNALAERREARERLWRDARRLGRFRRGLLGSASDRDAAVQWEGGAEAEQLDVLRNRIAEQKKEVEKSQKSLRKPRAAASQPPPAEGAAPPRQEEIDEEIWEQRELCNARIAAMHRDEQELKEREQRLNVERVEYLRQIRTIKAEDQVDFGSFIMLQQRYQLLRLRSRNGTTSVYTGHDLWSLHPCWVRIHQLDPQMADREATLAKLAQECDAIKQLRHPGITGLVDHFPHENGSSFVTVWENCEAETLDAYLLRNGPIPEKEARGVALQLLGALRFTESRGRRLDCQGLRPSRLAFRGGEVKVAGASLLSLGTEARDGSRNSFVHGAEVPPDSCGGLETQEPEVDALGVGDASHAAIRMIGMTLFHALFGKWPEVNAEEPLGTDLSSVQIPDQPKISAECRECLCRLLDRDRRLTVQEAYNDPFIAPARKPRG